MNKTDQQKTINILITGQSLVSQQKKLINLLRLLRL